MLGAQRGTSQTGRCRWSEHGRRRTRKCSDGRASIAKHGDVVRAVEPRPDSRLLTNSLGVRRPAKADTEYKSAEKKPTRTTTPQRSNALSSSKPRRATRAKTTPRPTMTRRWPRRKARTTLPKDARRRNQTARRQRRRSKPSEKVRLAKALRTRSEGLGWLHSLQRGPLSPSTRSARRSGWRDIDSHRTTAAPAARAS